MGFRVLVLLSFPPRARGRPCNFPSRFPLTTDLQVRLADIHPIKSQMPFHSDLKGRVSERIPPFQNPSLPPPVRRKRQSRAHRLAPTSRRLRRRGRRDGPAAVGFQIYILTLSLYRFIFFVTKFAMRTSVPFYYEIYSFFCSKTNLIVIPSNMNFSTFFPNETGLNICWYLALTHHALMGQWMGNQTHSLILFLSC